MKTILYIVMSEPVQVRDGEQRASTLLLFLVYLKDMSLKWKLVWMLQMSLALTRETISKKRNLLYGECGFVSKSRCPDGEVPYRLVYRHLEAGPLHQVDPTCRILARLSESLSRLFIGLLLGNHFSGAKSS
ncbi:hypothetical protein RUM43_012220 [Polyplax serrata]|uniref:Uncharacterized protein n=1 Tax=Polyplax serrata TaxID=468196 RepID=A0AAN8PTI5_POLSC